MGTFLLKINCKLHLGGAASHPTTASQWEGIQITFPSPSRIRGGRGGPVEDGDALIVWTHEYPGEYGNGFGLTAKGTARDVIYDGDQVRATLVNVALIKPHYSHRETQHLPSDSEVMKYLRSMRLLRTYDLEDSELRDMWDAVEAFQKTKLAQIAARSLSEEEIAIEADRTAIEEGFERRFNMQEVRPEQGVFRDALMSLYKGKCVISGCSVAPVLQAAHVIPFSEAVHLRNSLTNGLILRSDIHTLFDRLLLAINPKDSMVVIASELQATAYRTFEGKKIAHKAAEAFIREHYLKFRELQPSMAST
jgi:hypothetical protein